MGEEGGRTPYIASGLGNETGGGMEGGRSGVARWLNCRDFPEAVAQRRRGGGDGVEEGTGRGSYVSRGEGRGYR